MLNEMALGYQELLVILVIVFFLFGGSRLPDLAKGLGQSIRAFKEGQSEGEREALEKAREEERLEAAKRERLRAAAAEEVTKTTNS